MMFILLPCWTLAALAVKMDFLVRQSVGKSWIFFDKKVAAYAVCLVIQRFKDVDYPTLMILKSFPQEVKSWSSHRG